MNIIEKKIFRCPERAKYPNNLITSFRPANNIFIPSFERDIFLSSP